MKDTSIPCSLRGCARPALDNNASIPLCRHCSLIIHKQVPPAIIILKAFPAPFRWFSASSEIKAHNGNPIIIIDADSNLNGYEASEKATDHLGEEVTRLLNLHLYKYAE